MTIRSSGLPVFRSSYLIVGISVWSDPIRYIANVAHTAFTRRLQPSFASSLSRRLLCLLLYLSPLPAASVFARSFRLLRKPPPRPQLPPPPPVASGSSRSHRLRAERNSLKKLCGKGQVFLLMEEGEAATINLAVTRIFIGGLSTTVTAVDLEKTFSSLGRIKSLEFVRSDGRSFAYMDFEPDSEKALEKLFSTYNGCTWKGGKLRLGKAKEHYLDRLKREWAEDASITISVGPEPEKSTNNLRIPDPLSQEIPHLRFFFPKLGKVKALPYKGSGKHKYSFQRVEVPPMPVHFCDCEEHCEPLEIAQEKYISALHSAASEKEQTIASNVLSKLLKKEVEEAEISASRTLSFLKDSKVVDSSEIIQAEEIEEDASEADNLVINIGSMQSEEILIQQLMGRKMDSQDKESRISKSKPLDHDVPQNKAHPKKQQKSALSLVAEVALPEKASPASGVKLTEGESNTDSIKKASSDEIAETENHIVVSNDKSETVCATDTAKPQKANTWTQKSSWRELVGQSGKSSFSISNILPGMKLEPKKQQSVNQSSTISNPLKRKNPGDSVHKLSPMQKRRKTESDRQGSNSLHLEQNVQIQTGIESKDEMDKSCTEKVTGHLNDTHQEQREVVPKFEMGKVCTFMRTAESEKQLSKLNATLVKKKPKSLMIKKKPEKPKGKPPRRWRC